MTNETVSRTYPTGNGAKATRTYAASPAGARGTTAALIERLLSFGVTLPEEVVAGADQLRRLPMMRAELERPTPRTLLGLSDEELKAHLRDAALGSAIRGDSLMGATKHLAQETGYLQEAIADALNAVIVEHADDILDQLRPRFDEPARAVFEAGKLGIHPGTTDSDIVRRDDVTDAAAAWTGLPVAVRRLEQLAQLRMDLTSVAGVPPRPPVSWQGRQSPVADFAGVFFRRDAPVWSRDDFEKPYQRWLRLSVGEPCTLLSVAESIAAHDHAGEED